MLQQSRYLETSERSQRSREQRYLRYDESLGKGVKLIFIAFNDNCTKLS